MPDYLAVPEHRRDRAVHEKARMARRGELGWTRLYAADLDDDHLFGETGTLRFLDIALVGWASRTGWLILYDVRAIASRYGLRGREVKPALERLVSLRRFELIHAAEPVGNPAQIQPSLFPSVIPGALLGLSGGSAGASLGRSGVAAAADDHTDPSAGAPDPASQRLARARETRAEKKELPSRSNNAGPSDNPLQLPGDTNPLVQRLAGLVSRGDPRSASIIRYEAADLPESIVARTIESYLARRPRPSNPAGYVVATLRQLRAESGLPDQRPHINREPEL